MELADAGVGRRTGYKADGSFLKVGGIETCVYINEHKTELAQCSQTHFSQIGGPGILIRESVDSLCRDDADMPMTPYIRKACNRPNAAFVSLFR